MLKTSVQLIVAAMTLGLSCAAVSQIQAPPSGADSLPVARAKLERLVNGTPAAKPSSATASLGKKLKSVSSSEAKIEFRAAKLTIPAGAVRSGRQISAGIEQVPPSALPKLPPGLINVTEGGVGYRFLPAGHLFDKDVEVALPLKKLRSAGLWQSLRPRVFYFDTGSRSWIPLPGPSVESDGSRVVGKARHFTLMISGVLQTPDHAGPANFNENAISSLGAADPKANVDLIAPPEPTSFGDARTSFPLRLPPGRGAFSPQLALTYSSSSGNGPLGIGWDLPVQRITVDTRSGVPAYDGSERYLLDGNTLISVKSATTTTCLRRRAGDPAEPPKILGEFAGRIDGSQRIVRCEGRAGVYWEVVQKNGVRFFFGVTSQARVSHPTDASKIASWLLEEVEDPNANLTEFSYLADRGQKYLSTLAYTTHLSSTLLGNRRRDLEPPYRVNLDWGCDSRQDRSVSARFGFVVETACRLDSIDVVLQPKTVDEKKVRRYRLAYRQSPDGGQTLLSGISVIGAEGERFYSHSLSYTRFESSAEGPTAGESCDGDAAFCRTVTIPLDSGSGAGRLASHDTLLEETREESNGLSTSIGFSADYGAANCSVGASLGLTIDDPKPEVRFVDIDSDGYADRVWVAADGEIMAALGSAEGWQSIAGSRKGLPPMEAQISAGLSHGVDGGCGIGAGGGGVGVSASLSVSLRVALTHAALVDVDGDGVADLLSGSEYFRGLPRSCRDAGDTCNTVTGSVCQCASDGLRVCKPGSQLLCFEGDSVAVSGVETTTLSAEAAAPVPRNADAKIVVAEAGVVGTARDSGNGGLAARTNSPDVDSPLCKKLDVENSWGANTSVGRRLDSQRGARLAPTESPPVPAMQAAVDPARTVLRWDSQYAGTVRVSAKFRRPYCGGKDGVRISLLKVTNFHTASGTTALASIELAPDAPTWVVLDEGTYLDLAFNESLLFVLDTKEDVPVSVDGIAIDQVMSDIAIDYVRVCPKGDACRDVSDADREKTVTSMGDRAYSFRYPKEFSTAELPRPAYWRLLPPAQVDADSYVTVVVNKSRKTDTRVQVRVRCESASSRQGGDNPLCSLGDVLDHRIYATDEIITEKIKVRVPAPFISAPENLLDTARCESIRGGDSSLFVAKEVRRFGNAYYVTNGTWRTASFENEADAIAGSTLALVYEHYCVLGRSPPQTSGPGGAGLPYFATKSPLAPGFADQVVSDCVSYKPWALEIRDLPNGGVVLMSGRTRLIKLDDRVAANAAIKTLTAYTRVCYLGRGNSRAATAQEDRHRDFVQAYFDSPTSWFDPLRILVEVDGEGGRDVDPSAVKVGATLAVPALHQLEPVKDWGGSARLMRNGAAQPLPGLRALKSDLPVLYRVHPSRDLKVFKVTTNAASLEIKTKLVNVMPRQNYEKRLLHIELYKDGVTRGWISHPIGAAKETRDKPYLDTFHVPLDAPGIYAVRSYIEASFDPSTVVSVTAKLSEKRVSDDYLLLIADKHRSPETTYGSLDREGINVVVFKDSEAEWVARGKFSRATVVAVSSFDPLPDVEPLLPGSLQASRLPGGGILIQAPSTSPLALKSREIPGWLVANGYADATLLPEATAAVPPESNGAPRLCCSEWVVPGAAGPSSGGACVQGDRPGEAGKVCTFIALSRSSDSAMEVPTNLVTADFGSAYFDPWRMEQLVGEVPHSFDPYGGGRRGFFFGAFGPAKALECIGPYQCGHSPPQPLIVGGVSPDRRIYLAATSGPQPTSANKQAKTDDKDSDADGVPDSEDMCPEKPEDFRGIADDGCPSSTTRDTDGDGKDDKADECPYFPANFAGMPASSTGCPSEPPERPLDEGGPTSGRWESFDPPKNECYTGSLLSIWMCADGTHPSRSFANNRSKKDRGDQGSFSLEGFRRTWTLGLSASVGVSASAGSASGSLSGNVGFAVQYTDRDVMDWNGDGLVDFVTPSNVALGGRSTSLSISTGDCWVELRGKCLIAPGVGESVSASTGVSQTVGIGASSSKRLELRTTPEGDVKAQAQTERSLKSSISASRSTSQQFNRSAVVSRRMDLNGDGLPDQVLASTESSFSVLLNNGAELGVERRFPRASSINTSGGLKQAVLGAILNVIDRYPVSTTDSVTTSRGYGGSLGFEVSGFGGSVSGSKTDSLTVTGAEEDFADLNGDGLVDLIKKLPGTRSVKVAFNLGDRFGEFQTFNALPEWHRRIETGDLREGNTEVVPAGFDPLTASGSNITTWSGEICATTFFVKSCSSYQHSGGTSTSQGLLRDIDGDGIPDRVLRTGADPSGSIQFQRGLLGGANLLRRIERPLGGVIDMRYSLSKPSARSPRARWEVSRVTVSARPDFPAAGPAMVTDITYEDPYYDRYEREDFGYRIVKMTRNADGRVTKRTFNNLDFWLKGTLVGEQILDSEGKVYREASFNFTTIPLASLDTTSRDKCEKAIIHPQSYLLNETLRDSKRTPCDARTPLLIGSEQDSLEGGASRVSFKQEFAKYDSAGLRQPQYDSFGNPLWVQEHQGGSANPLLFASIEYDHSKALLEQHIVDRVKRVTARGGAEDGPVLRKRQAIETKSDGSEGSGYDGRGNLRHLEILADSNAFPASTARFDFTVDEFGFVTSVVDNNDCQVEYTPDTLTHSLRWKVRDCFDSESVSTYDHRFQLPHITTDINGNTITRQYDEHGRLSSVVAPYEARASLETLSVKYQKISLAGPTMAMTTNRAADPEQLQRPSGLRVARYVDWMGRDVQTQTDTVVQSTQAGAPSIGRAVSGRIDHDSAGRPVRSGKMVFRSGTNFSFEVLSLSDKCTTAGTTFCTTIAYDILDRPIRVEEPGGAVTLRSYDILKVPDEVVRTANATVTVDAEGQKRVVYRDSLDRIAGVTDYLGTALLHTVYAHSPVGDLRSVRDPKGGMRTYEYDVAGNRTLINTPDTGRMKMAYDAIGNMIQRTDAKLCEVTAGGLDAADCKWITQTFEKGRLRSIDYPGTAVAGDVVFTYGDEESAKARCDQLQNRRGRICHIKDLAGEERRSFGELGELAGQERTIIGFGAVGIDPPAYRMSFGYDSFGRLRWLKYPDGETLRYQYDEGGRVRSVSGAGKTYVDARGYDVHGKPLFTRFGNGVREQNKYFPDTQRLSSRQVVGLSNALQHSLALSYDQVGNITTSSTRRPAGFEPTSIARSYRYDHLYRLRAFSVKGISPTGAPLFSVGGEYDYDVIGNITRQKLDPTGTSAPSPRDWEYKYGDAARPNQPTSIGPSAVVHDVRGGMLSWGDDYQFTWDQEGRLGKTVRKGGRDSTYGYGADAKRLWMQLDPNAADLTLDVYLSPSLYWSARIHCERWNAAVAEPCVGRLDTITKHVRLDDRDVAAVSAMLPGGALAPALEKAVYLHADQVSSTTSVSGSTGAIDHVYEYLPFGELLVATGSSTESQGDSFSAFHSRPVDSESGLVYFGSRYLSPSLGRWLQPDGFFVGDPSRCEALHDQCVGAYAFTRNSPVNFTDPTGRASYIRDERIATRYDAMSAAALRQSQYAAVMAESIQSVETSVGRGEYSKAGFFAQQAVGQAVEYAKATATVVLSNPVLDLLTVGGVMAPTTVGISVAAKEPIWSSTKKLSSVENAFGHWSKHKAEFPELANSKQYVEAAHSLAASPPANALTKARGAETLIYDGATNTFLVRGADGAPKTMFRPTDGINYWNKQ